MAPPQPSQDSGPATPAGPVPPDIAAGGQFAGYGLQLRPFSEPAAQLDPQIAEMWRLLESQDWYGAEGAARAILDRRPLTRSAWCALGLSLLHQDRLRDALNAAHECPDSGLRRGIEQKLAAGAHFEEHQVAHFHVRYEGEVHEEIAREVLRLLESDYARLVTTPGIEPKRPFPVDLLATEAYVAETGKTASAGQYSHGDGRIRVKVRGLTVTPRFEETLLHELVHAFLGDLTRGRTPRHINEGMAQYVTGRRIGWERTSREDAARYPWKTFYDDSLSFTEYLIGQRGVRGVVDALRKLGETGHLDGSFREVFGDDLDELQRKWSARRRQLSG